MFHEIKDTLVLASVFGDCRTADPIDLSGSEGVNRRARRLVSATTQIPANSSTHMLHMSVSVKAPEAVSIGSTIAREYSLPPTLVRNGSHRGEAETYSESSLTMSATLLISPFSSLTSVCRVTIE